MVERLKKQTLLMKVGFAGVALFWLAVGLYLAYVAALAVTSLGWPNVTARVLQSEIVEKHAKTGESRYGSRAIDYYTVEVTYAYAVDGQQFTSRRYALFKSLNARSRFHEEEMRRPYLPGREVPAYYDPADPSRAVLVVGWRGFSTKLVTALGFFGFFAVAIGVLALRQGGKGRSQKVARKRIG
jgi:hypothetical protein